jgi:hypothetical protein
MNSPNEVIYGTNLYSNNEFYRLLEPGNLDFFICDSANLSLYQLGSSFRAFLITKGANVIDTTFTLPWDGKWNVVFSNRENVSVAEELEFDVILYKEVPTLSSEKQKRAEDGFTLDWECLSRGGLKLNLTLPYEGFVSIDVYSSDGKFVKRILGKYLEKGAHSVYWDGEDQRGRKLPSGMYLLRLKLGDLRQTVKVLMIR